MNAASSRRGRSAAREASSAQRRRVGVKLAAALVSGNEPVGGEQTRCTLRVILMPICGEVNRCR
jgi:hypothetical protein